MSYAAKRIFPQVEEMGSQGTKIHFGLTLLEYYAAHAPAEPQDWFAPVMPPQPQNIEIPKLCEWFGHRIDGTFYWDMPIEKTPLIVQEARRIQEAAHAERYKWQAEYAKQRLVQWPAAWARAVIADLKRVQP